MNIQFADSVAMHEGELIDCRYLTLAYEVYELDKDCILGLVEESVALVNSLLTEGFVCQWHISGRSVGSKRVHEKAMDVFLKNNAVYIDFEAIKRSPVVNNDAMLKKWKMYNARRLSSSLLTGISDDFISYWNALFPSGRCSNEELQRCIIKLFREKRRFCKSYSHHPDAQGIFRISSYNNNDKKYYGTFFVQLSAFSLSTYLHDASKAFEKQMIHLGEKYQKINGRVMLQPVDSSMKGSAYMDFFGEHQNSDGSHESSGQSPDEWYSTYYLPGVEWSNLISPRAQTHLPTTVCNRIELQDVSICTLDGGCLLIRSSNNISVYDIDDALALKHVVANALYPGGTERPLSRILPSSGTDMNPWLLPRNNWAIVPVFDEEVEIVGNSLVIR